MIKCSNPTGAGSWSSPTSRASAKASPRSPSTILLTKGPWSTGFAEVDLAPPALQELGVQGGFEVLCPDKSGNVYVLGLLLLVLCSHDWARRSWFKQGYPQTCSELPITKMPSVPMVNVGSWLRLRRCRAKTIAEPSSTLGRPISRIARFKLSCRSWTKFFWVFRYQCEFGAESSTAHTFWCVAARLKGPKIQTATAYTCQPGCSHGSDVRSNWHTLPMKIYIKDLDMILYDFSFLTPNNKSGKTQILDLHGMQSQHESIGISEPSQREWLVPIVTGYNSPVTIRLHATPCLVRTSTPSAAKVERSSNLKYQTRLRPQESPCVFA